MMLRDRYRGMISVKKRNLSFLLYGILCCAALIGLDQLTKYLAVTRLAGKSSFPLIPGVFELYYLENRGAAFGMLTNRQWFFAGIAVLMIFAAGYVYLRMPGERRYLFLRVICILIASGAAGNLLDRLTRHHVVDFLYFSAIDFPVFNVADCYVCIGTGLALLALFTVYREEDFSFLFPGKKEETRQ